MKWHQDMECYHNYQGMGVSSHCVLSENSHMFFTCYNDTINRILCGFVVSKNCFSPLIVCLVTFAWEEIFVLEISIRLSLNLNWSGLGSGNASSDVSVSHPSGHSFIILCSCVLRGCKNHFVFISGWMVSPLLTRLLYKCFHNNIFSEAPQQTHPSLCILSEWYS